MAFYRDPVHLASLDLLIDGTTLEHNRHALLVTQLLRLRLAILKHNDFVTVTNLAQAGTIVPDNVHEQWHTTMKAHHALIMSARDEVLSAAAKP